MIPFLDLATANRQNADALTAAAKRVITGGRYILHNEVAAFENAFAAYCGVKHCIGTGNGLDALILLLRAHILTGDLKAGDEILVPANTYIATFLAITHAGLTPLPVEADEDTFNITAAAAEAAGDCANRVRAVFAVHLYGRLAPMRDLQALCRRRGWLLFEDAAQAHGATEAGVRAGAFGDAAGFSFYPTKNLGAIGDGGAVTTDDDKLADYIRILRNYGSAKKYESIHIGVNSRLDELQAALLSVKLPQLDDDNTRRRALADRYRAGIRHPGITLPPLPPQPDTHVWHLFVIRTDQRDALRAYLQQHGVGSEIHYPTPPHRQQAYADTPLAALDLPNADRSAAQVLSLPLSPSMTDKEIDQVIAAVNGYQTVNSNSCQGS